MACRPREQPISPIGKLGKHTMGRMAVSDGGRKARSIVTPLAFDGMCSLCRVAIERGVRSYLCTAVHCTSVGQYMAATVATRQRRSILRSPYRHAPDAWSATSRIVVSGAIP